MDALPTGTVTFLFTDIEGSTALLNRLGPHYPDVLRTHGELLRQAVAAHGGREVDTQGDAFFVAFARAHDAVLAAAAGQRALLAHRWPEGAGVKVRMGVHTGEPALADSGYVGIDVHRAARICAVAWGAQILVSQATYELIADSLPESLRLLDLGAHRLKDLSRPQHLYQVAGPDLPSAFPSLRSLDTRPNNLPRQLSSFVGRRTEIGDVVRRLSAVRLLTLTGSGGVGKTRLALQAAAEILDTFPDGVWFVELASLTDPALVPHTVAVALGAREEPGQPTTAVLHRYVLAKRLLLILDNCEHLLGACAQMAEALLRVSHGLTILATSREGLGAEGEVLYPVPPLALPDPGDASSAASPVHAESVRLFAERAAAVRPDFQITTQNAAAVARLCRRLDGIPLALEMAAARLRALSVGQVAARLDDRFRLLTGATRTALPRHRTLRAVLDWGHELLDERERVLFRRLSVFAGGFTLEAAEAVCACDDLALPEVLDVLTHLVDKSMVGATEADGAARYRMLETIREYARDHLLRAEGVAGVGSRHLAWCVTLAETRTQDQVARIRRLAPEVDNLRAALNFAVADERSVVPGLRLANALSQFWNVRGGFNEGIAWFTALLPRAGDAPPALRARAFTRLAQLEHRIGRYDQVRAHCAEGLALYASLGDERGQAEAMHFLAHAEHDAGDEAKAVTLLEGSLGLARRAGDSAEVASAANCLGDLLALRGDDGRGEALLRESLALHETRGNLRGVSATSNNLARLRRRRGDFAEASRLLQQALATGRALGHHVGAAYTLAGAAGVAAARGAHRAAARLLGAARAAAETHSVRLEPTDRQDFDATAAIVRTAIGETAFAAAWDEGRALSMDEALDHAAAALPTSEAS